MRIGAGGNHHAAHDQGAEHAPEQDAMLIPGEGTRKKLKIRTKTKMLSTESAFSMSNRQSIRGPPRGPERVDAGAEQHRQRHPDDAPGGRLPRPDLVRLAWNTNRSTASIASDKQVEPDP